MLMLLIAIVICLVVPWLPVLVYRNLPRRLPPPAGAADLQGLAVALGDDPLPETSDATVPTDEGPTEITRQRGRPPKAPGDRAKDGRRGDRADAAASSRVSSPALAERPRLNLGSYKWLNLLFVPLFIVTFLGLGAGWAALFHLLGEEHARTFPSGVFLFKPFVYGVIFAVPGLFLGILTTIPLLMFLARLVLGKRRFVEYLYWDEGRTAERGMKPEKMIRSFSVLALLVGVGSAIFVCLVMNWYACFTEDEIVIKRLLGLRAEVHRYDAVQEIVVTSHRRMGKKMMEGPDLGVRFDDGRTWRTGQTFQLPRDPDRVANLIDFLRRKTGKPITRARALEDVPGW